MKGDVFTTYLPNFRFFFQELPAVINKLLKDEFILKPQSLMESYGLKMIGTRNI